MVERGAARGDGVRDGRATDYAPDDEVARALYDVLEKQVLPLFFERDAHGLPPAGSSE